jgi:hypothetical protein
LPRGLAFFGGSSCFFFVDVSALLRRVIAVVGEEGGVALAEVSSNSGVIGLSTNSSLSIIFDALSSQNDSASRSCEEDKYHE